MSSVFSVREFFMPRSDSAFGRLTICKDGRRELYIKIGNKAN